MLYITDNGAPFAYLRGSSLWIDALDAAYGSMDKVRLCAMTKDTPKSGVGSISRPWSWTAPNGTNSIASYALNGWFYAGGWEDYPNIAEDTGIAFKKESMVRQPTRSPLFFDSIWVDGWPHETDKPWPNLQTGKISSSAGSMARLMIARHGKRPNPVPTAFNVANPLPGQSTSRSSTGTRPPPDWRTSGRFTGTTSGCRPQRDPNDLSPVYSLASYRNCDVFDIGAVIMFKRGR